MLRKAAMGASTSSLYLSPDARLVSFVFLADNAAGGGGVQLLFWGCLAVLVSLVAVSAVFVLVHYQNQISREQETICPPTAGFRGGRSISSSIRNSSPNRDPSLGLMSGDQSAASSGRMSSSARASSDMGIGTPLPGLPLCPLLVVPDGTRLACVVQNDVRRRRQELSFDIGAVPARGGAPLFRVRVSELGAGNLNGIYVETLNGREQLAVLSTEDLWRGVANPMLNISRPWGLPYGSVQKGDNGEYLVLRGMSTLLVFTGDFARHTVQVMNATGHQVATTLQTSVDEYQVHMQARTDAGLVILGLLAIDKFELTSEPARSRNGGNSSAASSGNCNSSDGTAKSHSPTRT